MADAPAGGLGQVVVVGASLAGLRACETLRQRGWTGRIVLLGAEPHALYDRPPLSKTYLTGEWDADRIQLRTPGDVAALDLHLRPDTPAVSLDTGAARVTVADGTSVAYDGLIIATGSEVRRLPGQPEVDGVCVLRTLADADVLRARVGPGHRLVVIGAGFIGLEVAASAHQVGCDAVVLEGLPAPLMRALGPDMGQAVASVHARNGVPVRCGVRVEAIEHDGTRVTGVRLGGGEVVAADTVLVGVGVRPATDWLASSGIELDDGVRCDATLAATAPNVYAAGDCARWPNRMFGDPEVGEVMRVEHWTNAAEQGAAAASNLLAAAAGETPEPYAAVPFFWSDQFDSRIQFLGRPHGDDEVHIVAGNPSGPFAALYGYGGRLRAALGVSMPKIVMPFRRRLAAGMSWDDALATIR